MLGRQPIAILASSTALFRAEYLSPVCLPLTSSLNRLNSARPAGVPLQRTPTVIPARINVTQPHSYCKYLPTDCQTLGASVIAREPCMLSVAKVSSTTNASGCTGYRFVSSPPLMARRLISPCLQLVAEMLKLHTASTSESAPDRWLISQSSGLKALSLM